MIDHAVGDVHPFGLAVSFDGEALRVGLVAGAENGPTLGEDVRDVIPLQKAHAVLDEAEKAVFDAEDFQLVLVHGRLRDRTDDSIEAGTVAAAGEDSDSSDGRHGGGWYRFPDCAVITEFARAMG